MPDNVRKYTNLLLELGDEGVMSWKSIAEMALGYMSEYDVEDMFHYNDLDEFDPDCDYEDDNSEDDDEYNYEEEFEDE